MKPVLLILLASVIGSQPLRGMDPSAEALPDETGRQKFRERARILVDLDGDGTKDMLLSNPDTAGNSGVDWSVFLKREGSFRPIGHLSPSSGFPGNPTRASWQGCGCTSGPVRVREHSGICP